MTRTLILSLIGTAALNAAAAPADARVSFGWKTISESLVAPGTSDSVSLRRTDRYSQLRLCVANAPLRLREIDVRYRNGKTKYMAGERIDDGDCGARIDLSGSRRDVSRIKLRYKAVYPGTRRPLLRVQAR